MQLDKLADVVVMNVKSSLAPVLERLAVAEQNNRVLQARVDELLALRDRVTVVETKSTSPIEPASLPAPVDLSPLLERVAATEARLSVLGDLRDRVVTVETRAALTTPTEPAVFDAAPLLAKIDSLESQLRSQAERLLVAETKAAMPAAVLETKSSDDIAPVLERVAKLETKAIELTPLLDLSKDVVALRERVAVAEVRQLVPGPAGANGTNGVDGLNGKDGADGLGFDDVMVEHDGERTFTVKYARGERVKVAGTFTVPMDIYRGVYIAGKSYDRGDGVTWGGSEWHCNETTTAKPGESKSAWTLKVKRGRDGRDGKDADAGLPVVSAGSR